MTGGGRRRALLAGAASLGWVALAAGPGHGDPFTVRVACDDGTLATVAIDGDAGSAPVAGLPGGTVCTAEEVGVVPAAPRPVDPVPGAGRVTVVFERRVATPVLALSPPLGSPGETTRARGAGFPPGATVSLGWSAGFSSGTSVVADGEGRFTTTLLVLRGDLLGSRRLAATAPGGEPVEAEYLVVANNMVPGGPDARPAFRP